MSKEKLLNKIKYPADLRKIKVETATRDYIVNNGKTEFIELDGKRYNIITATYC